MWLPRSIFIHACDSIFTVKFDLVNNKLFMYSGRWLRVARRVLFRILSKVNLHLELTSFNFTNQFIGLYRKYQAFICSPGINKVKNYLVVNHQNLWAVQIIGKNAFVAHIIVKVYFEYYYIKYLMVWFQALCFCRQGLQKWPTSL